MKKFILLTFFIFIFGVSQTKAQLDDDEEIDYAFDQMEEKISDTVDKVVEPTINAFGAALGTFVDSFTRMSAMAEACQEEDKKSPLTQKDAEAIVAVISPDHIKDFNINIDNGNAFDFATGNFNIDNTTINIELTKTHCLYITDELYNEVNDIPQRTQEAVSQALPDLEESQNLPQAPSQKSYIIAGDEVSNDKFTSTMLNNMKVLKAEDDEKQSAYALAFIGTLGVRIKTHDGNYNQVMEQFLQYIDVAKLQQIIGQESADEIKKTLNKKIEEKLNNMQNKMSAFNEEYARNQMKYELIKKENETINIDKEKLNKVKDIFSNILKSLGEPNNDEPCDVSDEFNNIWCNLYRSEETHDDKGYHYSTKTLMRLELNFDYRYLFDSRWAFFYAGDPIQKDINGFKVVSAKSDKKGLFYETNLTNALSLGIQCYDEQNCMAEEVLNKINKQELLSAIGESSEQNSDEIIKRINKQIDDAIAAQKN